MEIFLGDFFSLSFAIFGLSNWSVILKSCSFQKYRNQLIVFHLMDDLFLILENCFQYPAFGPLSLVPSHVSQEPMHLYF